MPGLARIFLISCLVLQTRQACAESLDFADPMTDAAQLIASGYQPLFNGKDLQGWDNPYSHGTATVVDGEIHLTADKKFFLVTEQTYADFSLIVEIKLPKGPANSGVMFRSHVEPNRVFGYQAECDGSPRRWSGGLYDEGRRKWIWPSTQGRSKPEFLEYEKEAAEFFAKPEVRDALKRNDWNRYAIDCGGDQIRISLNGVPITNLRDAIDARGHIGIQHHGEKGQVYRFRNLFIKPLPKIPAAETVSLVEQPPKSIERLPSGTWLVDFGRTAFGNLLIRPAQDESGEVTVHFGENLKHGRVDRNPPGTVRYHAVVSQLSSTESVVVAPEPEKRNTQQGNHNTPPAVLLPEGWGSVTPFRWVEIEGLPAEFSKADVVRRAAFASDWDDQDAKFECSDETLNKIWDLCRYSIKATTFAGVYVDGDRERIPYEADAYLNQISHYYTSNNIEMARATFDWLIDHPTWPSEWAPHMVFMAYADWQQTGDREWLANRFDALKTKTLADRVGADGLVYSDKRQRSRTDIVDWPRAERDDFVFTEVNTVVNAFHISAMQKMSELATAIGEPTLAADYSQRANISLAAFHQTLFDQSTGLYVDGTNTGHSSLHANLFPLAFGLVPEDNRQHIATWLSKRGMQCSVYAAQYLLEGLFYNGADREAVQLISADTKRSWRHMLNSGTTITWEAWDKQFKPNLDWNHAWGAAPANLLPRFVLGVEAAEPGWTKAVIAPCSGGLQWARGTVPTPKGPIMVDWEVKDRLRLQLSVPAGMAVEVSLPANRDTAEVLVNGTPTAHVVRD